ncbi:hypothetical protein [Kitasatospora camelliae]|uniref:Uncharacterized protein n=1 Tax=Kitasatospora camelliae TaxID=3156397 RepID=A0AAU8JNN7_9ACTN
MAGDEDLDRDHRMTLTLFREVLDQPEPPVRSSLAEVRAGGRRLRRRRRLTVATAVAAVLVVGGTAAAGTGLWSAPGVGGPAGGGDGATSAPPRQYGMGDLDEFHDRFLAALRTGLPSGYREVADGGGPTSARLVREDGTSYAVSALMGTPLAAGARPDDPCEARAGVTTTAFRDCRVLTLPDGSTGWLSRGVTNPVSQAVLATPEGKVFGLGGVPGGGTRDPIPLDDLEALLRSPGLVSLLQGTPLDAPG